MLMPEGEMLFKFNLSLLHFTVLMCNVWCFVVNRYGKEVCDAVVENCLTGRPKMVEMARAIFMLWIELEAVEPFLV